jgi:hypothetical protein
VTDPACASCGAALAAGSAFCGACGARQPASCSSCGAVLPENAVFCGGCGARAGASAAAPAAVTPAMSTATATPAPGACASCGAPMKEGVRFCRKCGSPAGGGAPPASRPATRTQTPSAGSIVDQLTWRSAAAGLGFAVAGISAFLSWVEVSAQGLSVSAAPLDGDVLFRIGDIMGSKPSSIDGFVVLGAAAAGLIALVTSLSGQLAAPAARYVIAGVGLALLALGIIEIQYVSSRPEQGASIDVAFGLYLLVVGGALAAASPWLPARPLRQGGRP